MTGKALTSLSLIVVHDSSDEGRDQVSTGLSGSNCLLKGEHEGQVCVNSMFGLKLTGGLDTFPGGSNLDENPVLGDTNRFVKVNDVEGFVNGGLFVKGELGVNFGGNLARHNLQDLLSEFHQKHVKGSIDLLLDS